MPGFIAPGSVFKRHGIVFEPNADFQAAFNPAAFVAVDPVDKKPTVYMVIRGEKEMNDAKWKRLSRPYLAKSKDGLKFEMVSPDPLFREGEWYDKVGGVEDARYADLRLQPYVDPKDGRSFDGALMYTAYDGKTARVAAAIFNHDNLTEFRKIGTLFPDADVLKNPLLGDSAWNKSPAMLQVKDPNTGKVRNILYVGEGNAKHGGIMAMEADRPFGWKWPRSKKPVITTRKGKYDQNLVESAFQPVIAPLPPALAAKTGEAEGIYLALHGDSPPKGYQVGFRIFSLKNPTGKPLYASDGPFLSPQEKWEIEGQVGKVVFASASVEFNKRRFIYYGAADRVIGAISAPSR